MPKTLEEARERIIALQEQLTKAETERDAQNTRNEELSAENERVKALNQKYFNKLEQQILKDDPDPEPEDQPESCEEFAAKLKI